MKRRLAMKLTARNMVIGAVLIILVAAFLPGSAYAQNTCANRSAYYSDDNYADIVNGLVFRGKMGMLGEKEGSDEEISFLNGMFHSKLSEKYDLIPSSYAVREGPDRYTLRFCSENTNSKGDKLIWHGTIKLDHTGLVKRHEIEAYATLMPAGESSRLFWMKGKASNLSMKFSGKNAPKQMQTASSEDN
jgi:hypothetical protein